MKPAMFMKIENNGVRCCFARTDVPARPDRDSMARKIWTGALFFKLCPCFFNRPDPIEKPLYHFHPGKPFYPPVHSDATSSGYCQNWSIF